MRHTGQAEGFLRRFGQLGLIPQQHGGFEPAQLPRQVEAQPAGQRHAQRIQPETRRTAGGLRLVLPFILGRQEGTVGIAAQAVGVRRQLRKRETGRKALASLRPGKACTINAQVGRFSVDLRQAQRAAQHALLKGRFGVRFHNGQSAYLAPGQRPLRRGDEQLIPGEPRPAQNKPQHHRQAGRKAAAADKPYRCAKEQKSRRQRQN